MFLPAGYSQAIVGLIYDPTYIYITLTEELEVGEYTAPLGPLNLKVDTLESATDMLTMRGSECTGISFENWVHFCTFDDSVGKIRYELYRCGCDKYSEARSVPRCRVHTYPVAILPNNLQDNVGLWITLGASKVKCGHLIR